MKKVKLTKSGKLVLKSKRESVRELIKRVEPVKPNRATVTHASLNRVVTTNSLFKTRKNYAMLSPQEKREYVSMLSKEFISSAGDLLESLKDK